MWKRVAAALAMLGPVALPQPASAHPHVWVDTESAFLFDEQGRVEAIRIVWKFDELYSAFAIQGADENRDGETTEAELTHQAGINREHLAEWDYFTNMKVGLGDAAYRDVTEFGGRNEDGILVYWYVLPLDHPVDPRSAAIRFRTFDPSYYVAFDTDPEKTVALEGPAPDGCRAVGVAAGERPENVSDDMVARVTQDALWAADFAPVVNLTCG
ncbi:MAG: DUF1007 family protein [Minwuia sp.]|uniref:DUF1007 family protein n=1 Tax=Minwuia sp. TaxID=2493630 RepID=UPI003A88BFA3